MRKYNANNERIKRKYLTFLKQAKGQNEASIDAVAKAITPQTCGVLVEPMQWM